MVHDDTFIILKQNEQRRIINIISETYAGMNYITTVVSQYMGSINVMIILFRKHVAKNSANHSDYHNLAPSFFLVVLAVSSRVL